MRGRAWTPDDTSTLERMAGRPDAEIAKATGHCRETVARHRRAMDRPAYGARRAWSRRDWMLHDAAGLTLDLTF